jgi:O-antigen ligase
VLGIFTSFSRAAWANAVLTLALYVAFNRRYLSPQQRMTALGWTAAAAVGIVVFTSLVGMSEFFEQRANVLQSYDSERFAAQRIAIELGLLHPIGVGPGMSEAGDLIATHSVYLRSWAETGALSLIVLLLLMVAFILPFRDRRVIDSRIFGVSGSVLLASSIGQMVNGVVIDTLHWRHFWLLMGMTWLGHSIHRGRSEEKFHEQSETVA